MEKEEETKSAKVLDFTGKLIGTVPQSCAPADVCRLLGLSSNATFFDAKGQPLARNASPLPVVVQVVCKKEEEPMYSEQYLKQNAADMKELQKTGVFTLINKTLRSQHDQGFVFVPTSPVHALLFEHFGSWSEKVICVLDAYRRRGFVIFQFHDAYKFISQ